MKNAIAKVKDNVDKTLYEASRRNSYEGIVYINNDGYFVDDTYMYRLSEDQVEWSLPLSEIRGRMTVLTDDYEYAVKRHGADEFLFRVYGTSMLRSFFKEASKAFRRETLQRFLDEVYEDEVN